MFPLGFKYGARGVARRHQPHNSALDIETSELICITVAIQHPWVLRLNADMITARWTTLVVDVAQVCLKFNF